MIHTTLPRELYIASHARPWHIYKAATFTKLLSMVKNGFMT